MPLVLLLTMTFVAAFASTCAWLVLAKHKAWLDIPNLRSSHHIPTPGSGGVAIVLASLVFVFLQYRGPVERQQLLFLVAALALALLGLADDFFNLRNRTRFLIQLLIVICLWPAFVMLPAIPVIGDLAISGAVLAIILVLAVLWLINSYNFMDGIDGLAASEAIFVCMALSLLTVLRGVPLQDTAMLGLGAAVAGFLFFNIPPARIFMGDVGSYFLGFVLPVLGLQLISHGQIGYWSLLILLGTFISDSTTTLLGRLVSGVVWYHPHRSHAYQLLATRWQSHGLVVLGNLAINILWLLPLAWLSELYPGFGMQLAVIAFFPLVIVVIYVRATYADS